MTYKLWHLVVAFLLGAVVVAGVTLAPGSLAQGRIGMAPAVGGNCNVTSCDIYKKLGKVQIFLTSDVKNSFANMQLQMQTKLNAMQSKIGKMQVFLTSDVKNKLDLIDSQVN
ncbi:MAG: hypothetical protein WCX95_02865 [Candidatus Gracilibacteria bacterium]